MVCIGASGGGWCAEGDDPDAPPHKGEERRGLWFPRRKPGFSEVMLCVKETPHTPPGGGE